MNIDIVVVTYNRLEKLKHALECYDSQTELFRNLIVVNNSSTDNTAEFLDKWQNKPTVYHKVVINTKENLGGSGGFYVGQKYALDHNADWVFLADDDAYADKDMIKNFYAFCSRHNVNQLSVIASEVLNMNGEIALNHRCRYNIYRFHYFSISSSLVEDYMKEYFAFDIVSYVGPFINCQALKKVGLVLPEYFIYFDDSEHSIRLAKYGKLVCVPSIKITHDGGVTNEHKDDNLIVSWRDYYLVRNKENMLIRHFPFVGIYQYFRFLFFVYLPHPCNFLNKLNYRALNDAVFNKLGKNAKYSPGWSMKRE